jgi:hypothetical protein
MKKYGLSFSWKRLSGINGLKQKVARKTLTGKLCIY